MKKILKKIFNNKFILILLSIFLFLGTITFNAFSLSKSSIENKDLFGAEEMHLTIEESGDKANTVWDFEYRKFSGSVTGKTGVCSEAHSGTLTLTYNGEDDATITFDYTVELGGGSCKINGESKSDGSGEYQGNISKGETITFFIESAKGKKTTKINVSEFKCVSNNSNIVVVFKQPADGTYTVTYNNQTIEIDEDLEIEILAGTVITLKANANDGFSFTGWNFNNLLYSVELELSTTLDINVTIEATFLSDSIATFLNNDIVFSDLNDAIDSATTSNDKMIVLKRSGSVYESTTYTIPSGITLFIPNSESYNVLEGDDIVSKDVANEAPYEYLCLEIPSNTILSVASGGTIYVAGNCLATANTTTGSVVGPYGHIKLLDDTSTISLESGSILYCYGYITGTGLVNAKSGSNVHEIFQIYDWKGGDNSMSLVDNAQKVFIINQYYVQNIEATLRINQGANDTVHTGITALRGLAFAKAAANYIGDSGVFRISEGYIERCYDYTIDQIVYTVKGKANLSSISLKLSAFGINVPLESENYVLPITNNYSINVLSDSEITINQDVCLLPGTQLLIDENALLRFSSNVSLFVYDNDFWYGKKYAYQSDLRTINYSASINTKPNSRVSTSNYPDAEIDLNGEIIVNNGACIYSTVNKNEDGNILGAGNIHSSKGTGKITFVDGVGNLTETYQTYYSGGMKFDSIPVTTAILKNGSNGSTSYFDPSTVDGGIADKLIFFDTEKDEWSISDASKITYTITYINEIDNKSYTSSYTVGEEYQFENASDIGFKYNDYALKYWRIENVGLFKENDAYVFGDLGNIVVNAVWGGWIKDSDNNDLYIDYENGNYLKGINKVESIAGDGIKTYLFYDNGVLAKDYSGVYYNEIDDSFYYISFGVIQENEGLIKLVSDPSSQNYKVDYIYIDASNHLLNSGTFYIDSTNGLLPSGYYTFDKNGYINREDTDTINSDGEVYIKENNKTYRTYIDGIRVSYGLFDYNGYYYYSNNNGEIVRGQTFFVTNVNDTGVKQGLYYFDDQGRMYNQNFELWEVNNA